MINDVCESLTRLLRSEIIGRPNLKISFEHPGEVDKDCGTEILNLYLYEISENTSLRQDPFQTNRKPTELSASRKRPFARINLVFAVTAHSANPVTEFETLSLALAALMRNQVIPTSFLSGKFGEMSPILSVAQPMSSSDQSQARLWQAIGVSIRPSLTLQVVAPFDPFRSDKVELVREMLVGLGLTQNGDHEGRPEDVRGLRVGCLGLVFDAFGQPLSGVKVTIRDRPENALTDDRGFFYFVNIPPGERSLLFHRRGFTPEERKCLCAPDGLTNLLDPVIVAMNKLDPQEDLLRESETALAVPSIPFVDVDRRYPITVAGKLLFADGSPAAYVPVRYGTLRTVTDIEGRYRFQPIDVVGQRAETEIFATYPGVGEKPVRIVQAVGTLENALRAPSSEQESLS